MKYTARKFQQNQYDKCDSISRKVFVEFIENRGHTIVSKEEDYNHDIVTEKDGVHHYFELETKRGYPFRGRKSFPFQSVSFLGRKKRLSHLLEPFTSEPKNGTKNKKNKDIKKR